QSAGGGDPLDLVAGPVRGQTGVEQADQVRRVDERRLAGPDVVRLLDGCGHADTGDLDAPVAGAQQGVRVEVEVVQAAAASRLETDRGLADQAAGLLGGQQLVPGQR